MDSGLERECAKGETETLSNKRNIKVEVEETKKIKLEGYCYSCRKYYSEEERSETRDDINEVKSERCAIEYEVKSKSSEIKNEYVDVEQEIIKDEPNNDDESESEYIEKEDDDLDKVKVELCCIVCQSYGLALCQTCVRCLSCGVRREENWDFKNVKLELKRDNTKIQQENVQVEVKQESIKFEEEYVEVEIKPEVNMDGNNALTHFTRNKAFYSLCNSLMSEMDLDSISVDGVNKDELIEGLKCELQKKCTPQFCIICICKGSIARLTKAMSEAVSKEHYAGKRHQNRLHKISLFILEKIIKKRCIQKLIEREQKSNLHMNSMNINLEFTKQLPDEDKVFCELCHEAKQSHGEFKRHLTKYGHKRKKRSIELYIRDNSVIEEIDDCEVKDSISLDSHTRSGNFYSEIINKLK